MSTLQAYERFTGESTAFGPCSMNLDESQHLTRKLGSLRQAGCSARRSADVARRAVSTKPMTADQRIGAEGRPGLPDRNAPSFRSFAGGLLAKRITRYLLRKMALSACEQIIVTTCRDWEGRAAFPARESGRSLCVVNTIRAKIASWAALASA